MSKSFCPQAVIFDMDGLLVDSEPVWGIAEGAMMRGIGREIDPEIQKTLVGLRMRDFLAGMCDAYALTENVDNLCTDLVTRMIGLIPEHVVPRPGARELLQHLYDRGIPAAIASSSPMPIIDATVAAQGWGFYFQTHVSGDDVAYGKPAPDIYLEAARRLGVEPIHCLTLEDSPTGARSAVAAGMICYAVPDLSHTTVSAFADVTEHVYDSLHDVLRLLEGCPAD